MSASAAPGPSAIAWSHPELAWLAAAGAVRVGELISIACEQARWDATLLVTSPAPGELRFEALPFDPTSAERASREPPGRSAWLLPIFAARGMEARIRGLVAAVEDDPAPYRRANPIPLFVPATGSPEARTVETRLQPAFSGFLPGDAWPLAARAAFQRLVALLRPDRYPLYLALENCALGGFSLSARPREPGPGRPRTGGPIAVVVCGIDGSGKSSHVAALGEFVRSRGLRAATHKIFRHGVFHETVTDLTRLCAGGHNLHLWRIERLIKVFDSVKHFVARIEPKLVAADVVLFDRYVYTHQAAVLGRSHHDELFHEMLSVFPEPDLVFLLDLSAEAALARIGRRGARTVDENPYMLDRYRRVLLDIAERRGFPVLDAQAPFQSNQDTMRRALGRLLGERSPG